MSLERIKGLVLVWTIMLAVGTLGFSHASVALVADLEPKLSAKLDAKLSDSDLAKKVQIDTCFSPNEVCDLKLISFINKANVSLDIAIYSITHQGIADAIMERKNQGVEIRMVVDRTQSKGKGSLVSSLISNGINIRIGKFSGIMHDKYTIVDGKGIETGSYNYTSNATNNNGENQLYIDDQDVVQRYKDNFDSIWSNARPSL